MKKPLDWKHVSKVVAAIVVIIAIDQAVKFWARNAAGGLEGRVIAEVIPKVFELKLVYNRGVAFGMFQGAGVLLTPIAILIAGFSTWSSISKPEGGRLLHATMVLLASGAIGNLIDRLAFGKVTDMFYARIIDFPVFNVADAAISIAGALLVWTALRELAPTKQDAHAVNPDSSPEA